MYALDRDKLLANDPETTAACTRLIRSFLRKVISDPIAVADAVQSTMVRLIAKLKDLDEVSSEDMLRFVSNATSNTLRRRLTQLRHNVVAYVSELHSSIHDELAYADYMDRRQEIAQIERLLEGHNGRDLLMFILRVQGYTNEEIADRFGVTTGTVRTATYRTRTRLRLQLSARETQQTRQTLIEIRCAAAPGDS